MKQQQYKVGAYCRLSREDEDNVGESGSITNQREMIKQYCKQNNLGIEIFYQGDGFTGTNFERPDFKRMIEDIESGKINCVITKELSLWQGPHHDRLLLGDLFSEKISEIHRNRR